LCSSAIYSDAASYSTGDLVQNAGAEYRCTVGGWCTVGGPYAPGPGWAWQHAWSLVGSCQ
jgi:chitin-binding protein